MELKSDTSSADNRSFFQTCRRPSLRSCAAFRYSAGLLLLRSDLKFDLVLKVTVTGDNRSIAGILHIHRFFYFTMEEGDDVVKNARVVEARARNISNKVRCIECGSQSIEDSQADIAILLRQLIRDEIKAGKSDKEIFGTLKEKHGETVLYKPTFDSQTAVIYLTPVIVAGVAAGIWAYQKHRQRTNVHIMALNLVRGVPLTPKEKQMMLEVLTPPPQAGKRWWNL